jgi:signal transduction histidine kinase
VRKIVQDLRDFSRVGETQWQWADIHHGLDSTLNIVWNELKYTCEVIRHYGKLPQINCVPSQLNQVFMNLLVNAAQSIEGHGQIVITTECVGEDAVRVSIADTGRGIPAQHLKRIFEPFFTTKPVGKGTGLGLSLAWSIVERHGGRIEVSSEIGKGTTFSVTLPIEPVLHETGESAS